ncbi:MAG: diaminopimelate decarboxylase [Desulfovibrio sp.]|nr:diaminopimelate decarboxylase [Desulfovibrio sp.]MBR4746412.1 diaminopimelate decarboxylase [Desulfovibrio sp.]
MSDIRSSYTDDINFYRGWSARSLAERYGTPLYVYSEAVLRARCRELMALCPVEGFGVNYSVKANTNPAILAICREEGLTVDAMSPGELYMDELAGFGPDKILYISNNIDPEEMKNAIAHHLTVSVDSLAQLELYGALNPGGDVMIRINPGIGEGHSDKVVTAGKETKFAISPDRLDEAFALLKKHGLRLRGVNQHIGSLFMQPDGYLKAAGILLACVKAFPRELRDQIEILDFGGGFGIPYRKYDGEARLDLKALGEGLAALCEAYRQETGYRGRFLVEPGRYVVAEAGILLGRVEAVKNNGENRYAGTNLGFNVLVRPVMYGSYHDFEIYAERQEERAPMEQTVTGNICESGDVLAKKRLLPEIKEGDILGVLDAGAYGYAMASTYNQRLRPAEVLIREDGSLRLIRRRETFEDLSATLC